MGKNKIRKWADMEQYPNVIQPPFEDVFRKDHELKGKWNTRFFKNNKPLVLELGCGKGEYTVGMASRFPGKNFIGVDIKGARMWKGARTANEQSLSNVGFLRTRIEMIESFFDKDEVDEIWITFPDPQLKKRRIKKRLTSSRFLNYYSVMLKENGLVHLKTDSRELYDYTMSIIAQNEIKIVDHSTDIYSETRFNENLAIRTHYEQIFLDAGKKITYICFIPDSNKKIIEPPADEE